MKGDFSRITYRPRERFAGVLMQQGRVVLDSDWNEQEAITRDAVRAVARDVIGPHGGVGDGFRIRAREGVDPRTVPLDFLVEPGIYYVDGVRCRNGELLSYRETMEDLGCSRGDRADPGMYLVYLDVWDRVVSAVADTDRSRSDFGGDPASLRTQVTWQVRLIADPGDASGTPERSLGETFAWTARPAMRARVVPPSGYTGLENRLYRVEIHTGGGSEDATFKWSRNNGSTVAPVVAVETDHMVIEAPEGARFEPGTWVEPEDGATSLCGHIPPLIQIVSADDDRIVTSPAWPLRWRASNGASIRRWDQGDDGAPRRHGAIALAEGTWMDLEDGIQISFDEGGDYRPGDPWTISARTTERDIGWPTDRDGPLPRAPMPMEHHRAPLAHLEVRPDGSVRVAKDLRRIVGPLAR